MSVWATLVMTGLSAMCTDDFDDSDCPNYEMVWLLGLVVWGALLVTSFGTAGTRRVPTMLTLATIAILGSLASIVLVPALFAAT
ncbi:hypothetical protein QSJ18_03940 [Gordonia sp. ABSL1-1]|uniref:hypothetical protein n=1 Tax=Gordonia sp. ABSL1-1 TaxID=3053923 RepID=UPI002573B1DB|nr:hypothetical protein [Gordonia sp. ABSL1-1]MDL9935889.1 hypothetical protein [Gordonia sp. ABSL1-1]